MAILPTAKKMLKRQIKNEPYAYEMPEGYIILILFCVPSLYSLTYAVYISVIIGVRDGGQGGGQLPLNSGSLSTLIRAESRHYSGKTQHMFE